MLLREAQRYYQLLVHGNQNQPLYLHNILHRMVARYAIHFGLLVWGCSQHAGYNQVWTKRLFDLRRWYYGYHENRMAMGLWFVHRDIVWFHMKHALVAVVLMDLAFEMLGIDLE
jgi:hypothetical protein